MPRHLISDAHEWMNEISTVLTFYLAKKTTKGTGLVKTAGKKDPVELYSSLYLQNDLVIVGQVGERTRQ